MINSRRWTEDPATSCAKCIHLRYSSPCYCCGIDGAKAPDPDVITLTTCNKWKEVRKDGS